LLIVSVSRKYFLAIAHLLDYLGLCFVVFEKYAGLLSTYKCVAVMNYLTYFRSLCLLVGLLAITTTASAQVHAGADFASRYVWRGFDFGESFSVQPSVSYSNSGFTVGSWASYSISADGSGANEHDLYVSYSRGPIEVGLTDYFFPAAPGADGVPESARFFNFDDNGEGAHTLEPYLALSGPSGFPVELYAAILAYNDPDKSVYLEASYPFTIEDQAEVNITAGFVPMESAFYLTENASFVNLGLSVSKVLEVTETFSLPLYVGYTLNPDTERTFLVFGFSIGA
jgi:hypothetical protein